MAASIAGVLWQAVRFIRECRGRCLPGGAKYKRALEALARRDGVPVVRPPFGARNQHGGQIAALTENHILSSCDMLYPTEESSFFSIALVRAAGRKKVADQYVCGSPGNKPGAPQQAHTAFPL